MKIKSTKAFAITNPTMGGAYSVRKENEALLRRPPWTRDAEGANPMARYSRYKALRSSWLGNMPAAARPVSADDGVGGVGRARHGHPVARRAHAHPVPLLAEAG